MVLLPFSKDEICLFAERTVSFTQVVLPGARVLDPFQQQYSESLSLALAILSLVVISVFPCKFTVVMVLALLEGTLVSVTV
jgi:hypothetical protein